MANKTEEIDPWKIYFYAQDVFDRWLDESQPAHYAYQSSRGQRIGILIKCRQRYLPEIQELEQVITRWADKAKKDPRTPEVERILRYQTGRIRRSISCINPDDIETRFPEYESLLGVIERGECVHKITVENLPSRAKAKTLAHFFPHATPT